MIDAATYASINSELSQENADRDAILARHGLDEAAWEAAEHHWDKTISKAMDQDVEADGVPPAIATLSAAFVTAQQQIAGEEVMALETFARATREIGQSKDIGASLKRLGVTLPAFLKANQYWCLKMVHEPALAETFRKIIAGEA